MDDALTCPCKDGLPDPCTVCGEPADGICKLDEANARQSRAPLVTMLQRIHEASWATGQERPVTMSAIDWPPAEQAVWAEILPAAVPATAADLPDPDEDLRCPHCNGEPGDPTSHREGCVTLDTCAQTEPDLERPWHPESEWLHGGHAKYGEELNAHIREAHGGQR
ncbi:MAG TPA: hypothetical protein VMW08_00700 [Acidimicrobiales bacterium]|nr:hypothetical protein [Acidimicrobiales bacterium]